MSKNPSLKYEVVTHMQQLEAFGESRFKQKQEIRERLKTAGEKKIWSVSTGKMHAHKTASIYTGHILRFSRWVKEVYGIRSFKEIKDRYGEFSVAWLLEHKQKGDSPYSLKAYRSALRMCFQDKKIGEDLDLGKRKREDITRSRLSVKRDLDFNENNHQSIIEFLESVGLRRREIETLHVSDVAVNEQGALVVNVRHGKGGKKRVVPVIRGMEMNVLSLIEGRSADEHIYNNPRARSERGRHKVPSHLDVHSLRRRYAQALYIQLSGCVLPSKEGQMKVDDYDLESVLTVSRALGHSRKDVVLNHYIR